VGPAGRLAGQQLLVGLPVDLPQPDDGELAARGDLQRVPSAVGRVAPPLHQPGPLQDVDQRDQVAGVEQQHLAHLALGHRLARRDDPQNADAARPESRLVRPALVRHPLADRASGQRGQPVGQRGDVRLRHEHIIRS
jgi:hypothetical protein